MVQGAKYREKWTLDAWNTEFKWGSSDFEQADRFLLSQMIKIPPEIFNIPVEALRCVGFTKLYEAGRIVRVVEGEGGGGLPDSQAMFNPIDDLDQICGDLDERDAAMQSDGMDICVQVHWTNDTVLRLMVLPSDRISVVKAMIHEITGIQIFVISCICIALNVEAT
jgi:hypothetical protein